MVCRLVYRTGMEVFECEVRPEVALCTDRTLKSKNSSTLLSLRSYTRIGFLSVFSLKAGLLSVEWLVYSPHVRSYTQIILLSARAQVGLLSVTSQP